MKQSEKLFELIDVDGDGTLTETEFLKVQTPVHDDITTASNTAYLTIAGPGPGCNIIHPIQYYCRVASRISNW